MALLQNIPCKGTMKGRDEFCAHINKNMPMMNGPGIYTWKNHGGSSYTYRAFY